jgi:hypothetical protein
MDLSQGWTHGRKKKRINMKSGSLRLKEFWGSMFGIQNKKEKVHLDYQT